MIDRWRRPLRRGKGYLEFFEKNSAIRTRISLASASTEGSRIMLICVPTISTISDCGAKWRHVRHICGRYRCGVIFASETTTVPEYVLGTYAKRAAKRRSM